MKRIFFAVSLLAVAVCGFAGCVGRALGDQNFAGTPGAELVRALVPVATRGPALRELCRRAAKPGAEVTDPDLAVRVPAATAPPAVSPATAAATPSSPPPVTEAQALNGLSDEELWRFFGPGRNPTDDQVAVIRGRSVSIVLPGNFWNGPPREVALALAELNRTAAHRADFRLAVDARDGAAPPAEGSVLFDAQSSRCYQATDGLNFLRFGPAEEPSYYIHLGRTDAGMVFFSAVNSQPAYDLRWCELSGADARQLAAVLWWLDRVRSRPRPRPGRNGGSGHMMSTADGHGTLQVIPGAEGASRVRLEGTLWSGAVRNEDELNPVAGRWEDNYGPEVAFNLAARLLNEVLPARLGPAWSRFEPRHSQSVFVRPATGAPTYEAEELTRLRDLAARALAIPPGGQRRMAYPLLGAIVEMVGNLGLSDLAPALRDLSGRLPSAAPDPAVRTAGVIRREMDATDDPSSTRDFTVPDPPERQARRDRWQALYAELQAVEEGTDEPGAAEELREKLRAASEQLATTRDPAALATTAADRRAPRAAWALQQLRRLGEDARAADVLAGWLARAEHAGAARQVFAALAEMAPARARRLAEELPADRPHPLFVPAFALLAKDGGAVPAGEERRRTLLAIVLAPKAESDQRQEAINLLVPEGEPARYPEPEVDSALRRLLDDPASAEAEFTREYLASVAADALARRGRTEDFERILAHAGYAGYAGRVLEALAVLLPRRGPDGARELETFLREQLTGRTNLPVDALLLNAWITDRRDLRADVLQLATVGPEESESQRAHRYGGEAAPLAGERFHLARQVAALWGEDHDGLTQAKVLVAFALHYDVANDPARRERFTAELGRAARDLTPEARGAVGGFLDRGEAKRRLETQAADAPTGEPPESALRKLVRGILGLTER